MKPIKESKLGFLGAGNMAGALIKGLCHGHVLPPRSITASDVKTERLEQLGGEPRDPDDERQPCAGAGVRRVVLAVKPQVIDQAC